MTLYDFYDALDNELNEVIADNPQDVRLHKGDDSTRKSFAFLIWFMKFYGKRPIYNLSITEGDDDTSCDIIFSTYDNVGKKIVYVVQAKWKSRKNCVEKLDSTAFKATLDDFKLVYAGQKQFSSKNENFNRQYEELQRHLSENQYVKFVYLTLCQTNPSVSENLEQFKKQYADIEIIDIERLRRDFIEMRCKEIKPQNPLEYDYNPEEEIITLPIEQLDIEKNFLKVDAPFVSYTFLVRPQTIHDLFEKYGFKLFFWNIRNPLIASSYNQQIEQSLKDSSSFFWYYNNGITAITQRLPKRINATAQQIDITALQIINGAQTVYSIYQAYKNARNGGKSTMNANALISFRLIQGIGNKDFELNVTRYTNVQNPMGVRDFWANHPVQVRLQNESFITNHWYSIRRGEFRVVPSNVKVVLNEDFIEPYLEFMNYQPFRLGGLLHDEDIVTAIWENKEKFDHFFNETINFPDLLLAYRVKETLFPLFTQTNPDEILYLYDVKIVLSKIFEKNMVQQAHNKLNRNTDFFLKIVAFAQKIRQDYYKERPYFVKTMEEKISRLAEVLDGRVDVVTEQEIDEIDWKGYFNKEKY
jgi:AIPR protein